MALQRQQHPRSNRYRRKGGRGGSFALAAFLVITVLLIVGGYILHRSRTPDSRPAPPTEQNQPPAVRPVPPAPQAPHSSAAASPSGPVQQEPARLHDYDADTPDHATGLKPRPAGKARLALIIDDMGAGVQEAHTLAAIGVPLTFSIIPGLRHDREVASFAAAQGIEIMVHMPMQSKEYPQRRLEANGLLLSQSDDELKQRVEGFLDLLPQAVGANNHTGSAFTEDAGKMRVVLAVLKQRGLYFVDSVTTPATTGFRLSREFGIPTGRRDVFLDNEQNEAYIRGQLAKAVTRASRNGEAIAICHPHPATLATLAKVLPDLRRQGITLVPVSHLVR